MVRTLSVAVMTAFAVCGCAAPGTSSPPAGKNPSVNCPSPPARSLLIWFGERELAPGEVLPLRVLWIQGPNHVVPVAAHCVTGWRLDAQAPASLDLAAARLAIRPDAADGQAFTLQARVGDLPVTGSVRVVEPALHPLKGTWTQTHEIACGGTERKTPSQRVGELRFSGSGQFSVTVQPFERYVDYGGSYRFVPATGQLTLESSTGNRLPVQRRWTGAARLTPLGELVVERLPEPIGGPPGQTPEKVCEQVFRRN